MVLLCPDLWGEPGRWFECCVSRYDRPWPSTEPWLVDPSDGFFGLGIFASVSLCALALPWRRLGVGLVCAAGLAIGGWSLRGYIPRAGTPGGMRGGASPPWEAC